ncbi:MAG TPA: sigma-54 dependent transcriptional regulator [Myxococcota bacterium]|nr:sigma-54 dependent transcriptional regulator [Myxococcota bacterium]HRY95110.1 sigma-54 dependent transcriptional regulator [Myxococcota bacterium]HSA21146.1 sigma-54 dependent transcriptional regulator [Myxococcota bacterium]
MSELLVVDDERSMREFLEIMFTKEGHSVRCASGVGEALARVAEREPDLVITDLRMKGSTGIDLLRQLKAASPGVEVIVVTAYSTDETAYEALRLGAYDYVHKPFQVDEIRVVAQRALERQRLLRDNVRMRVELSSRYDFGNLVGRSARMQEVYRLIEQVAPTRSNVLITGESGTGKELVARALHARSERRDGPFVPIDCSSIPASLMEGELFGHVRGAFTGANADRRGLFELADGGTVFLDEIGEVPASLQVKLLRVIQERSLKRLGDGRDRAVDLRVVAATNRDIEAEVRGGGFREDLFYRLNVIRVHLPPLRTRREDIPELVRHFVDKVCRAEGRAAPLVLPEAVEVLRAYDFPGNVRELENLVERAVALCGAQPISAELFADHLRKSEPLGAVPAELPAEGLSLDAVLASLERRLLEQALQAANGVKTEAAKLLGISFRSLRYRLSKLGIE